MARSRPLTTPAPHDVTLQSDLDAELNRIAEHLTTRRDAILAAWGVAARRDPHLTAPVTLSRAQFYDHIPHMLDALVRSLRARYLRDSLEAKRDEVEKAESHGLQRWQQGYNEDEVMREWVLLNGCLGDELEAYALAQQQVNERAISVAWRLVSEFTIAGMRESVGQYSRLLRTEAEGRLQAIEEAMRRLNDLETQRAALWREAAHDLRGKVGVVRNVTELMRRADPGVASASLDLLERSVGGLHALLDDLMAQARLDAGRETRDIRSFDVSSALRELCVTAEVVAVERGLGLQCEGPDRLLVEGDEIKVRRVAQNLMQNALMYTTAGVVKVSWDSVEQPPARWTLCVADSGPGLATQAAAPLASAIEAATRDTLGVEATARNAGDVSADPDVAPTLPSRSSGPLLVHGEGVGLSIVKRLCELLDASIELQTAPGEGTTFRVTFPSRYPKD